MLRTGCPCTEVVIGVRRPTGELRWVLINTQPLTEPGRQQPTATHGVVGSFYDITERRRAEQALLEVQSELEHRMQERTASIQELESQRSQAEKLAALAIWRPASHMKRTTPWPASPMPFTSSAHTKLVQIEGDRGPAAAIGDPVARRSPLSDAGRTGPRNYRARGWAYYPRVPVGTASDMDKEMLGRTVLRLCGGSIYLGLPTKPLRDGSMTGIN